MKCRRSCADRRRVAANSKWQVFLDHLADGHGNEVLDYLVLESLEPRPENITGICVLPILHGQFVLIRSYRHALATQLWEMPRGFLDAGETPAQAARRELTEETGLTCSKEDLVPLGFYAPEASTMAARGGLFVARNCTGILAHRRGRDRSHRLAPICHERDGTSRDRWRNRGCGYFELLLSLPRLDDRAGVVWCLMRARILGPTALWVEVFAHAKRGGPALFLDRDGVIVEEVGYLG